MFKIYTAFILAFILFFSFSNNTDASICIGPSRSINVFSLCEQGDCKQYFYTYEEPYYKETAQNICNSRSKTILKEDKLFDNNPEYKFQASNVKSDGVYHLIFTNKCNWSNLDSGCLVFNKAMLISIDPQDYLKIKEEEKNKIIKNEILVQNDIKSRIRSAYLQAIFYPFFPLLIVYIFRRKAILAAILGLTALSLPFFFNRLTSNYRPTFNKFSYFDYYEVAKAKYYAEIITIVLTCVTIAVIFIFLFSKYKDSFKTPRP